MRMPAAGAWMQFWVGLVREPDEDAKLPCEEMLFIESPAEDNEGEANWYSRACHVPALRPPEERKVAVDQSVVYW